MYVLGSKSKKPPEPSSQEEMRNCGVQDRLGARATSPKTEDTVVNPISYVAANNLDLKY